MSWSLARLADLAERDVKIRSQFFRTIERGVMSRENALRFIRLQHGIGHERVRQIVTSPLDTTLDRETEASR